MAIEIVSFPMKDGDFPVRYVSLPEGIIILMVGGFKYAFFMFHRWSHIFFRGVGWNHQPDTDIDYILCSLIRNYRKIHVFYLFGGWLSHEPRKTNNFEADWWFGMSSSQLTKSYFSEGWLNHQPETIGLSVSKSHQIPWKIFPMRSVGDRGNPPFWGSTPKSYCQWERYYSYIYNIIYIYIL